MFINCVQITGLLTADSSNRFLKDELMCISLTSVARLLLWLIRFPARPTHPPAFIVYISKLDNIGQFH